MKIFEENLTGLTCKLVPDDSKALNDFWSISGNYIYRHHVEQRVKLYVPQEESCPIPLRDIGVTRTLHLLPWMSYRKAVLMIIETLMGIEICQRPGQVSHSSQY